MVSSKKILPAKVGIEKSDPKLFSTNALRVQDIKRLNGLLTEAILHLLNQALVDNLQKKKVPAGVIQTVAEALESKEARGLILEGNGFKSIRSFVVMG